MHSCLSDYGKKILSSLVWVSAYPRPPPAHPLQKGKQKNREINKLLPIHAAFSNAGLQKHMNVNKIRGVSKTT